MDGLDVVVIALYMLILLAISFYYSFFKAWLERRASQLEKEEIRDISSDPREFEDDLNAVQDEDRLLEEDCDHHHHHHHASSHAIPAHNANSLLSSSPDSSYEYFLAKRDVKWWAVGFSLFSSNIGSEHLVGLAGSGALTGLAVGNFEWLAVYSLLLLGWAFLPLYLRANVYTTPEFLEKRFNPATKLVVSSVSLLVYVFMRISTSLYSGAIVLNVLLGWNVITSSIVMVLATGTYVIIGGLAVVIYTEVFQSILLLTGSLILVSIGLFQVGGWDQLVSQSPPEFFHMIKPASDPLFPWPGIFGALFTFAGVCFFPPHFHFHIHSLIFILFRSLVLVY